MNDAAARGAADAADAAAPGAAPAVGRTAMVAAVLVGWSIIGFGVWTAIRNADDAHPQRVLSYIVAFDLLHDLLVAPLVLVVAWAIGKVVPVVARGPVRVAVAASALAVLFSYPLVRGWGRRRGNSSTLPLDYGRNLSVVIVIIWVIALVVVALRVGVSRGRAHPGHDQDLGGAAHR